MASSALFGSTLLLVGGAEHKVERQRNAWGSFVEVGVYSFLEEKMVRADLGPRMIKVALPFSALSLSLFVCLYPLCWLFLPSFFSLRIY
jgi:hypothetical protein